MEGEGAPCTKDCDRQSIKQTVPSIQAALMRRIHSATLRRDARTRDDDIHDRRGWDGRWFHARNVWCVRARLRERRHAHARESHRADRASEHNPVIASFTHDAFASATPMSMPPSTMSTTPSTPRITSGIGSGADPPRQSKRCGVSQN